MGFSVRALPTVRIPIPIIANRIRATVVASTPRAVVGAAYQLGRVTRHVCVRATISIAVANAMVQAAFVGCIAAVVVLTTSRHVTPAVTLPLRAKREQAPPGGVISSLGIYSASSSSGRRTIAATLTGTAIAELLTNEQVFTISRKSTCVNESMVC